MYSTIYHFVSDFRADGTRIEEPADGRDLQLRITGEFNEGCPGDYYTPPANGYFSGIEVEAVNFDESEMPRVLAEMRAQYNCDPDEVFEEALFEELEQAEHDGPDPDDYCQEYLDARWCSDGY